MMSHFLTRLQPLRLSAALLAAAAIALGVVSCGDGDGEPYPPLVTEMVMSSGDEMAVFSTFTTDDGHTYKMANTLQGTTPNVRWRFLCGYVVEGEGTARVYIFRRVPLLADVSRAREARHDPTGLASVWQSGGYVNMHLLPKTQGGQQAWGLSRDSAHINGAGGTNYFISVCHHQLSDPAAYSDDLFVSIDPDTVAATRQPSDSLILSLFTFDGWRTWRFPAD